MKKLLSYIALLASLIAAPVAAQVLNPLGVDTTTGQQKVNTTVTVQNSGSGDFVDTGSAQNITGVKTITGSGAFAGGSIANGIRLPNADPSVDTGIGFLNNVLKIHDGTSARTWLPIESGQQGLYNICFKQGGDSSILSISSCSAGAALSASNPGYVRIRSSTAGTYRTVAVTADVTLDLTGAHWGLDGKGNTTNSILRVYAVDDAATLRWGAGYQGGFYYIRSTQDDATATNINLPEEILINANNATDNTPVLDVGYIFASFTDASNEWAITEYHPNESADGIWQPWTTTHGGFSADPTFTALIWMQVGKTVFLHSQAAGAGTSNATTYTMTAPIKADDAVRNTCPESHNNGVAGTSPALAEFTVDSVTINFFQNVSKAVWTGSGAKLVSPQLSYRAYQP